MHREPGARGRCRSGRTFYTSAEVDTREGALGEGSAGDSTEETAPRAAGGWCGSVPAMSSLAGGNQFPGLSFIHLQEAFSIWGKDRFHLYGGRFAKA